MNRSSAPTTRESITARLAPGPLPPLESTLAAPLRSADADGAERGPTMLAPAAAATRSTSQVLIRAAPRARRSQPICSSTAPADAKRLTRDRRVVERELAPAAELLALLVALARDHEHVARLCLRDRLVDRDRTVCDRADRRHGGGNGVAAARATPVARRLGARRT